MANQQVLPRKRPTQRRATVTTDAILIAVEQVLERDGLDGLTTNRVAAVAGVSIGSLYQYFPNKQALVRELHERYLAQTLDGCRALLAACDGVPLGLVCQRTAAVLVAMRERQRPIHRWLIELRSEVGFQERYRELLDGFAYEVARFLARRPDVRFEDPRAAAWVIVHALEGIVQAVAARGREVEIAPLASAACELIGAYLASAARG
jgi:AcrR family transcriptional regulator